jgi:hypothetical protein
MQTCKGKTKSGAACRAPAGSGGLCFFHANPDSARALGQIGGRKNRRSVADLEVPDNMTAADLRNVTVQAIRLLLSGNMHARQAGALAQLCNSLYRFIPTADLEARVATLEQQVATEESEPLSDRDSSGSTAGQTDVGESNSRMEAPSLDPIDVTAPLEHRAELIDVAGEAEEA